MTQIEVVDCVSDDLIGVTDSGQYITEHRWENELFKLLSVRELEQPTRGGLESVPAHLRGERSDEGDVLVTHHVIGPNLDNWLRVLDEKRYLIRNGGDLELTEKSKELLNHIEGGEHDFEGGFCTGCCYPQKWMGRGLYPTPEIYLDRMKFLLENPGHNPVKEDREEFVKNAVDDEHILELLDPGFESGYKWAGRDAVYSKLELPDTDLPEYEEKKIVGEKLEELVESGGLARLPFDQRAYCSPDLDIHIRGGEILSVRDPSEDTSEVGGGDGEGSALGRLGRLIGRGAK